MLIYIYNGNGFFRIEFVNIFERYVRQQNIMQMTRKAFLPWRVIWVQGKTEKSMKQDMCSFCILQPGKSPAWHYRIPRECSLTWLRVIASVWCSQISKSIPQEKVTNTPRFFPDTKKVEFSWNFRKSALSKRFVDFGGLAGGSALERASPARGNNNTWLGKPFCLEE